MTGKQKRERTKTVLSQLLKEEEESNYRLDPRGIAD